MLQPATAKYPVCADGLRKVLKYIKENYNDPEIIVTGNGYKEKLEEKDVLPHALSDSNRKYYHMRHLMALHGAVWLKSEESKSCCRLKSEESKS
ncbi:predicted protein [Arabidopsis lyrata subsp. lyrata]|uniref:Predicted protein n=2 Tax=Arabidopsis lyrata subsp. lyrata TaxID=81972 RepID=D7L1V8_ARALL|nr:predicted protein [Arabidopsis lyrata subsp. lyrata]